MSAALLDHLARDGRALSQAVLERMYRDPFWADRFGTRGRRYADEDSDFHLRYLGRALAQGSPGVMVRYAQWLRGVLNARGMCTRHLAENYRLLAEALDGTGWEGVERASSYLRQAREALRHPEGPARWLQDHAASLVAEAGLRGASAEDAENYLSYVADALAEDDSRVLLAHTTWMRGYFERAGRPAAALESLLASLARALASHPEAAPALALLREAGAPVPSLARQESR